MELRGEVPRDQPWPADVRRRIGFALLAVAMLPATLVFSRPATAQYSTVTDLPPYFEWRGQLRSSFDHEFETDIDGGDEFDAWRLAIDGDLAGPINQSILVGVRVGYQYARYDFNLDEPPGSPPTGNTGFDGDPWNSINTFDAAPMMTVLIGESWSVVAAAPIRYSGENGARQSATTGGAMALVRWQVTDTFRAGLGIGVTSQIEENAETFPVISLDWAITPSWTFMTEGNLAQGGDMTLLWGPNRSVRLSISGGYERNRFRLDDNGNGPDKNGVGEIRSVPVEVGVRFEFLESAHLDFRVGVGFGGRFRVEDSDGDKLKDKNHDPAPRVGIGITIPLGRRGE